MSDAHRPSINDEAVNIAIKEAGEQAAPDRLVLLDKKYELSKSQCLRVGEALAEIADRVYEEEIEDDEDADPDELLDARMLVAAALQISGGAAWELEATYGRKLKRGEYFSYRIAKTTLDGWSFGDIRMLAPIDVELVFPKAKGRDLALRLVEDLLPTLRQCVDLEKKLVKGIERALKEAREVPDFENDRAFVKIGKKIVDAAVDEEEAQDAAQDAEDDPELNRIAYTSHLAGLILSAARAALGERPDFEALFDARVGIGYPKYALEESLDRYYSKDHAEFDELSNMTEESEAKILKREIQALVEEAALEIRRAQESR